MQAAFQGIATATGLANALYRTFKASFRYTDAHPTSHDAPDPSGYSPRLVMQFWVSFAVLQTLVALNLPYMPELRMVLLLLFFHSSTAVPVVEGVFKHGAAPAIDATLPHVVPRLKRMQRSSQKAALAALQPLVDMANGMLLPYASAEDLYMARDSLQDMLAQVRKRRRAVEVHNLAQGLTGDRAAAALGAAVAEGAALLEGQAKPTAAKPAVAAGTDTKAAPQRKLLRQPSDRSSLEAAAQGAWSAVNGFMSMIPAAKTADKPPPAAVQPPPIPEEDEAEGKGEPLPPPAVTGGSADFAEGPSAAASGGGSSGDSPWKGAKIMEDLDEVADDDDSVPLAFVDDSGDSGQGGSGASGKGVAGRHSEGLPMPHSNRVAHGTGRQTVFATPGYKMRKRSTGSSASQSPGSTPPSMAAELEGKDETCI